ncbi:MAG: type IX secretion system outer membrane channel protein PorV [Balneolales bacterium]
MKVKHIAFVTIAMLGLAFAAETEAQVGITAVPFLQIEPDTRAAGMGNTGVSIADNASAVFWNPAGLAFQTGNEISITHANWLPQFDVGLFYDYLVGKYEIDGIGVVGGHVTFLNLGEQNRTGEAGPDVLGSFSSYEIATGLSYGFKINENFAVGTGLRFIYSNLVPSGTEVSGQEARDGTSVGLDLSSLYRPNSFTVFNRESEISAGVNLSNIGSAIQYTDEAQKDPLPTLLRLGWSYKMDLDAEGFNTLTLSNDFSKIMARTEEIITTNDDGVSDTTTQTMGSFKALFNSWDTYSRHDGQSQVDVPLSEQFMIGLGAEYWYNEQFALRTGYFYESPNNGNRQFLTFGAGLRYDFIGIDFSYLATVEEHHPLANTIRLSLLLDL